MGAATPVTGEGQKAPEKIVSAMRSEMRGLAEARGLDPRIAEAMVDDDVVVEGLVEQGKLLTLTAAEAERVGYARQVDDWDAALADLELTGAEEYTPSINWAERVVRFLTHPAFAPLLLSLGFLGLLVEIKAPGFGLPGAVGVVCLALFFGGHALVGLAGWEEVLLFSAGLILLLIEVFAIPGFGIFGIAGIAAILGSLFMTLTGPLATAIDYTQASAMLTAVLAIVLVGAWILVRTLPGSGRFTRSGVTLGAATTRAEGYLSAAVRPELLGAEGVATTDLRPAGAGRFGDEFLDVVSEGGWIPAGTPIRVIRAEGYRHVVRALTQVGGT
jgi:membrane-bound serine protease (ClpP class)